jgi:hypothetical protein
MWLGIVTFKRVFGMAAPVKFQNVIDVENIVTYTFKYVSKIYQRVICMNVMDAIRAHLGGVMRREIPHEFPAAGEH